MPNTKEMLRKYGQAVQYLPPRLREFAARVPDTEKVKACEFRLRVGRFFAVSANGEEKIISETSAVRREELQTVLELATRSSVHSSQSGIKDGYITVTGGHRIGICGTAIKDRDFVCGFRDISSASIRIAKSVESAAEGIVEKIHFGKGLCNVLIVSPPGQGKTTTLRDLVRRISDSGKRISLVDERGEIAAKHRGVPQFDVGKHTDVIDGIDKACGAMMMLRTMTPDIIALDEITAEEDIEAIYKISNCGVGIIATAHGEDFESLITRPLYKKLIELNIFNSIVLLKREAEKFSYSIMEM